MSNKNRTLPTTGEDFSTEDTTQATQADIGTFGSRLRRALIWFSICALPTHLMARLMWSMDHTTTTMTYGSAVEPVAFFQRFEYAPKTFWVGVILLHVLALFIVAALCGVPCFIAGAVTGLYGYLRYGDSTHVRFAKDVADAADDNAIMFSCIGGFILALLLAVPALWSFLTTGVV